MNLYYIFIFIAIFAFVSFIGIYEIVKNDRNPLPKFENGDKRIEKINVKKTRSIIPSEK